MWELYLRKETSSDVPFMKLDPDEEKALKEFLGRQKGKTITSFRSENQLPEISLPTGDTTGFTLYRAARETTTRGDASRVAGEIEAGTFDTAAGNLESANQVTMESAMKEFLRTGNTQKLIDEADAVRASQGIAPSAADPGAPKPGYLGGGERIVAIIRRNSDPS